MQAEVVGAMLLIFPIHSISCLWWHNIMQFPAQINNRDLNRACVTIWKNAKLGRFKPSLAIIIPSWLKVDKAIIFFMSVSVVALNPAINIVVVEINSKI